jgi:hypothetical protein
MITTYECTDCKHCANFNNGDRVICMHPELSPDNVCYYLPVGYEDALNCGGFDEETGSMDFNAEDFRKAEEFSAEHYNGDIGYKGVREWVETQLLTNKKIDN